MNDGRGTTRRRRRDLDPVYRPELPIVVPCAVEGCTAVISPRFGGGRATCSIHREGGR